VGPRTGPDVEEKKIFPLPGLELRPLGGPARSQSVHVQFMRVVQDAKKELNDDSTVHLRQLQESPETDQRIL
jgi:hypothetical protein